MMRVLMIAYHFPPLAGSSGIQRTLCFVRDLPEFGWQPAVLSAHPRAYERTDASLDSQVPPNLEVRRAFALDTARHLAILGRYIASTARPDRWASWKFDGVRQGMRLIREFQPQVIWSTYPIATAHLIAAELHRRSGIPWVADFRDPMAQNGYPRDPRTWQHFDTIERQALHNAACSVFTAPGAAGIYRSRYPDVANRIVVLENGYDEDTFAEAERTAGTLTPLNPGAVTLLHSGIVYPSERDPTQLFVALRRLNEAGRIRIGELKLRFRAAVHDELLRDLAERNGVGPYIEILPAVSYRDALHEMLRADALLAMQGSGCNEQIPAKIYEYLRAGKPIICLSDPAGDTVGVLRQAGVCADARLDSAEDIANRLPLLLDAVRAGKADLPDRKTVHLASRRKRAEALARILDDVRN
jgi:glycosyltransferase involved in cell wall biosynthesis